MAGNSSQLQDVGLPSHFAGDDEDDIHLADHRSTLNTVLIVVFYLCVHVMCVFGNSVVLLVLSRDKRRRSITGFFLCNLAVADLAVGLLCTGQYWILILLMEDWVFGHGVLGLTMCKMYGFIRSLSYFATINILMLVAVERFFAIVHPFTSRMYLLSPTTLKWGAFGAWLLSGVLSLPAFLGFDVFHHQYNMTNPLTGVLEEHAQDICFRNYEDLRLINWPSYELVCFILWYIVPCIVLTVLYFVIGRKLWRSANFNVENSSRHVSSGRSTSISPSVSSWSSRLSQSFLIRPLLHRKSPSAQPSLSSESPDQSNIVRNRRKVIRMLVVIVVLFMVCWLPVHLKKLLVYNYYDNTPFGAEDGTLLYFLRTYLTPVSDWLINFHSACNPIVYVLMSESFRTGVRDLFCRSRKPAFQPPDRPAVIAL